MKRLPLGKFPRKTLEEIILSKIRSDESVLLPPKFGEDGSVIKINSNLIISAADPITGATKYSGWLSVHVNANDIAVHGAKPKWFTTILLFPKNTEEEKISNVIDGIMEGLNEINASLIGGHSEITERVNETIIAGFMMGIPYVEGKYISSSGARIGDHIIMTKGAGIEGTLILASDLCTESKCGKELILKALEYRKMISVIPEVETLIKSIGIDHIHALHDATEGGLINAVYELAAASNAGFEIWEEKVIVRQETKKLSEIFRIDPLKLISSGTLIAAVDKKKSREAVSALRKRGIEASVIGEIKGSGEYTRIKKGKREEVVENDLVDELWVLLEKTSN